MIVEIGHYALVLALVLAIIQTVVPFVGVKTGDTRQIAMAPNLAFAVFAAIALSFTVLTWGYVTSDFSILNVWENSNSQQPLLFKFTGVWGNHEGSMLLWVLILALFGALVGLFGSNLPPTLRAMAISVQGLIAVAFLGFILFTSNPFERLSPAPLEGQDLNPILQDIGLAIHPPLLYLGYVGFSICFSFAIAALIEGRIDAAWARWVRPWTLTAWVFLTAGIAMGSYWAYYELGWGGWWFWDPVENASFMPWLAGTALLHSALVMEKREALKVWTILLAILTFSLSLLGTFLVRSGVLTSVHAFATDPTRGVVILGILVFFIGGALFLFALRSSSLSNGGMFHPISREGGLVLNNLILTTATATVFVGTLYPLLIEALTGEKISVGAPYFDATFVPLMVPLLLAVPFGPLLAWKRGDLYGAAQRLYVFAGAALLIGVLTLVFVEGMHVLAVIGIAIGVWLLLGSFAEIIQKSGWPKAGLSVAAARLRGLPRSVWGTALAHAGLGVCVLGIVSVSSFQKEEVLRMKPGAITELAGYTITMKGIEEQQGPNFVEDIASFEVYLDSDYVTTITPSKRIYTARRMPTTESGIYTTGFSQLYLALGDPVEGTDEIVVRLWWKPQVTLIWLGPVLMVIGGLFSLSDRRLRVGAPKPSAKRRQTLAAAE